MNGEIYSGEMKAVNHKPMNRPKGTPTLQGREEVSVKKILEGIAPTEPTESRQGLES
jgi:hypothetical protein